LLLRAFNKILESQLITGKVKQVNSKQQYGNQFLQQNKSRKNSCKPGVFLRSPVDREIEAVCCPATQPFSKDKRTVIGMTENRWRYEFYHFDKLVFVFILEKLDAIRLHR